MASLQAPPAGPRVGKSPSLAVQQSLPSCFGDCDGNHNAVFNRNYKETCADMGISPNSAVLKMLHSDPKTMCLLRLRALSFRNYMLGDRGMEALLEGLFPNVPHLELVNLAGTNLRNSSTERLLQTFGSPLDMPKLCALDFGDNPALSAGAFDPLLRSLERNENLLDLGVQNTGLDRISEMVLHVQLVHNRQKKNHLDTDARRLGLDGAKTSAAKISALYKSHPESAVFAGLEEDFPDAEIWFKLDDPAALEDTEPRAAFAIMRWRLEVSRLRKIDQEAEDRAAETKHRLDKYLTHRLQGGQKGGYGADSRTFLQHRATRSMKKEVSINVTKSDAGKVNTRGRRYNKRSASPNPRRMLSASEDGPDGSSGMPASLTQATLTPNALSRKSVEGVSAVQAMYIRTKEILKESESGRKALVEENAHLRMRLMESEQQVRELRTQLLVALKDDEPKEPSSPGSPILEPKPDPTSVGAAEQQGGPGLPFESIGLRSQLDLKDRVIVRLLAQIQQTGGVASEPTFANPQPGSSSCSGTDDSGPAAGVKDTAKAPLGTTTEQEWERALSKRRSSAFGRVGGHVRVNIPAGGERQSYPPLAAPAPVPALAAVQSMPSFEHLQLGNSTCTSSPSTLEKTGRGDSGSSAWSPINGPLPRESDRPTPTPLPIPAPPAPASAEGAPAGQRPSSGGRRYRVAAETDDAPS